MHAHGTRAGRLHRCRVSFLIKANICKSGSRFGSGAQVPDLCLMETSCPNVLENAGMQRLWPAGALGMLPAILPKSGRRSLPPSSVVSIGSGFRP